MRITPAIARPRAPTASSMRSMATWSPAARALAHTLDVIRLALASSTRAVSLSLVLQRLGPALHARPPGVRLEVTAPAAGARPAAGHDHDVADLPGEPGGAATQLPVEDEAAADARPHEHAEQLVGLASGAEAVLGDDPDVDVVVDHDLVDAERLGERRAEGERLDPPGEVGRRPDHALGDVDDAGRADADGVVGAQAELVDDLGDGVDDAERTALHRRLALGLGDDVESAPLRRTP